MSAEEVNDNKRRFLVASTSAVGAVGAGFVAVPFIKSWMPSAKAKAAGAAVKVDISKLEEGQMVTVEWRGKPVFIVKRNQKNLDDLEKQTSFLADSDSQDSSQPAYCANNVRARKEQSSIAIMEGVCTHLGCAPKHLPDLNNSFAGSLGDDWLGGFFCPCHGSKYDLSGRVYSGMPAPLNLPIPPYKYLSESLVLIGEDEEKA
ncbi:MAG: ubiquinol-cytochrome c reductase iron-sulfur subunit [Gammaproteobacteria bacterium]|nr:ubiquinol-cytochrome c reductase iron-sulfur subunit [Gammaproteobacteria bacterium]